jgi:DNA-binding NtrC family response regulator
MSTSELLLIGESAAMRRLRALVATVAPARLPVLIEGETGTGKELVATMLHRLSGRSGALVAFNVCALGDSMFEDALFGHARGAYTGAVGESLGFLREADGGTLFLDEITGLPLPLQAKLLRAIETGVFRPIGAARDVRSDFRVVAATNERLEELVAERRFRSDLSHRLRGVVIGVPTLGERVDDIPLLVEHFVRQSRPGDTVVIMREAMDLLQQRAWPGNVRELKQVVEAAVVFGGNVVDHDALVMALANGSTHADVAVCDATLVERRDLLSVLERMDWDTEATAKRLGVHRATVYRKMKRLGIEAPPARVRTAPHQPGDSSTADHIAPLVLVRPGTAPVPPRFAQVAR